MTSNPFIVQADEVTITHNGDVYTLTDLNPYCVTVSAPYCVTVSAIDEQGERCELTLPIVDIIKAAQAEEEHRQRCEKELSEANWEDEQQQLQTYDVTVERTVETMHGLTVKASSEEEAREIAEKYMDEDGADNCNYTKTGAGVYDCEEINESDSGYEVADCSLSDNQNQILEN